MKDQLEYVLQVHSHCRSFSWWIVVM